MCGKEKTYFVGYIFSLITNCKLKKCYLILTSFPSICIYMDTKVSAQMFPWADVCIYMNTDASVQLIPWMGICIYINIHIFVWLFIYMMYRFDLLMGIVRMCRAMRARIAWCTWPHLAELHRQLRFAGLSATPDSQYALVSWTLT